MKDTLVNQCLALLKREDIKKEIKTFLTPIMDVIVSIMTPYMYIGLSLILINILIIFVNIILLLYLVRNKSILSKHS
jgi:uncharacterized membrane protein